MTCRYCNGTGKGSYGGPDLGIMNCLDCNGNGTVTIKHEMVPGFGRTIHIIEEVQEPIQKLQENNKTSPKNNPLQQSDIDL